MFYLEIFFKLQTFKILVQRRNDPNAWKDPEKNLKHLIIKF